MARKHAIRLAILVAGIALAAPIVLSIHLARRQALEDEYLHVSAYARDVLGRTDSTTDQIVTGFERLKRGGVAPCSAAELAVMREIDLGSSYIQAIGRVGEGGLVCSSLGMHVPPVALGPVDVVSPRGARIRFNVPLTLGGDARFLILERDGFAAIIHPALLIDATTAESTVSLASFLAEDGRPFSSRGTIDPSWVKRVPVSGVTTFLANDHVVAVIRSDRYHTAAVAAVPRSDLERRAARFAMLMLPVGVIAGGVLAVAVVYLTRVQLRLPAILKAAIRNRELFVVYQPIVDLANGRWIGAEALVRWHRRDGTMERPDTFIPIAEESGLIHDITKLVLQQVTRDLAELVANGLHSHISVNLAAADLHMPDTLGLLQRVLSESGAAAGQLHVEATERGFMRTHVARKAVDDIRALGVRVSIDDFGTGYSSLSYLESFKLDYLKIDKSFVDSVGSEAATSEVVRHIIEMAKSLNLAMIAEGVETEEQAAYLRDRGVQFAQGWLFAKPLPFAEFLQTALAGAASPRSA